MNFASNSLDLEAVSIQKHVTLSTYILTKFCDCVLCIIFIIKKNSGNLDEGLCVI